MTSTASEFELSVLFGSGGSRAIVAAAGAVMALGLINKIHPGRVRIKWCGGISGGATLSAMLAAGVPASEIVNIGLETDYQSLLVWHGSYLRILIAFLRQKIYEKTRPCKGVLNPEKLRLFVQEIVGEYPEKFWTMAVSGDSQIIFTSFGVFELFANGQSALLAHEPPEVGTAVIASCAVPGIIDAVSLYDRYLFDGALSKYGACPVEIAVNGMGIQADELLAVEVGDDFDKGNKSHTMWDALFGVDKLKQKEKEAQAARVAANDKQPIMVRPKILGFCGLQFEVPAHLKWKGLMETFFETINQLEERGIVTSEIRLAVNEIAYEYEKLPRENDDEFVLSTKQLLLGHGLYAKYGESREVAEQNPQQEIQAQEIDSDRAPAKKIQPIEKFKGAVSQVGLRAGRWLSDRFARPGR